MKRSDILKVLAEDWDPIGIGDRGDAEAEYASYAGKILEMLEAGKNAKGLVHHLERLETDAMGFSEPSGRAQTAVEALVRMRDQADGR